MNAASVVPSVPTGLTTRTFERIAWASWFLAFGLLSALWPRDAGFDVMHYHLHNGWSALHGRLHHDLAPAEMHSFLNPAYNLVVWWLIERLPGPAVAFLLGLVQGAILPVLYGLSRRMMRSMGHDLSIEAALAIAALGFFCAPAWSNFASLRNDHIGALAFLVGLYVLLPREKGASVDLRRVALAAGCVGFAAGLKLTNVIYVPAFAMFALLLAYDWQDRLKRVLVCTVAGGSCLALAAGPWMAVLWQDFANPVFPNFADLFPGPDAAKDASRDVRYLPANLLEALTLPLRASFDGRYINELAVIDLRLGLAFIGAGYVAGMAPALKTLPRPAVALAASILTLLAAWIGMFSIMRYASAVWMLAPLIVWVAWSCSGRSWPTGRRGQVLAAGLSVALLATTSPENIRRIAWESPTERYVTVERPEDLSYDNALIFIAAEFPAAFTATAFLEARLTHIDAQAWSAPFLANYRRRIADAVETHDGPLYLIHCWSQRIDRGDGQSVIDAYSPGKALQGDGERYGLSHRPEDCRELKTSFSTDATKWQICPLQRQ
ncbi:MAG: hypothetical protein AAFX86_06210 [Pseudomonadota bacterium]